MNPHHRIEQMEARREDFDRVMAEIRKKNSTIVFQLEGHELLYWAEILCWQAFCHGIEIGRKAHR